MKRRVQITNHWGAAIGYSRAVRAGNIVIVSGTTAAGPDGALHPGNAEAQAHVALERIQAALGELGASLADVMETRVFLKRMIDWEAVGRAHGAVFTDIRPATTLLQVGDLISEALLVEIAVTSIVGPEA